MNQEQVKEKLLQIRETDEYFTVILSGKKSRKVNGLYKPENREIILHNRNFTGDNELMYTAIHEYAHHLQFTTSPVPVSARTHTAHFWSLFHSLLYEAERQGVYSNPFQEIEEFRELTMEIRGKFLGVNGELMKELGRLLVRAQELCEKHHTSFTDYLDRVLSLPRASATAIIKSHLFDLDPRVGYENMKTLARVADPDDRKAAEEAFLAGASPDMVKERLRTRAPRKLDPLEELSKEKKRIERQIERLKARLDELERRMGELQRREERAEVRRELLPGGQESRNHLPKRLDGSQD
jgi:hypothetical protein